MKVDSLRKRLDALQPEPICSRCQALESMSDAEIDQMLYAILNGEARDTLPEPSPTCRECHKNDYLTDQELDARLAWLLSIVAEACP